MIKNKEDLLKKYPCYKHEIEDIYKDSLSYKLSLLLRLTVVPCIRKMLNLVFFIFTIYLINFYLFDITSFEKIISISLADLMLKFFISFIISTMTTVTLIELITSKNFSIFTINNSGIN